MKLARARLTHTDPSGKARMVDVSGKKVTARRAVAEAVVWLPPEAMRAVQHDELQKGDALGTARLAGIMAAKRTGELIPLCHPLPLDHVEVSFEVDARASTLRIVASARTRARTGVEMEAMTAAALAAITIYDMAKGVSKGIELRRIRLLEKSGGKSGLWLASGQDGPEHGPRSRKPRPARASPGRP